MNFVPLHSPRTFLFDMRIQNAMHCSKIPHNLVGKTKKKGSNSNYALSDKIKLSSLQASTIRRNLRQILSDVKIFPC